jgi:prepilin-type N-terminal cleavage/methylation domain-containing protein
VRTEAPISSKRPGGFTMVELLVGSAIMLVAVLGALFIYSRSNKVSVEQQMVTEVQNDVRSSMFFLTRDLRMAGAGLPQEFSGFFIEGWDNENQGGGGVAPDRVRFMGNIEDPLNLAIQSYSGSAATLFLDDYSLEQYPYPDEFYVQKTCIVLPNPESGCLSAEIRIITQVTHNETGTNEAVNFSPGLAPGVDPPGGLSGTCTDSSSYNGGTVSFVDVKEYWLDVTGSFTGLTPGANGYIGDGVGGVLYVTHNGVHLPLARNVENFQVEYNGDMNNDLLLDGWTTWVATWTSNEASRIQQVRVWVLGRTARAFTSVGANPPDDVHIYRRPAVSNSPAATDEDRHRRFLMDSTSNVRNMSFNLYNINQR